MMTSVFARTCIGVIAPWVLEIPIQSARNTVTPMSVPIGLTRDGPVGGIDQLSFLDRAPFVLAHRTEVESEICNGKNKQDCGDRIEVCGDRSQERLVAGKCGDFVSVQDV